MGKETIKELKEEITKLKETNLDLEKTIEIKNSVIDNLINLCKHTSSVIDHLRKENDILLEDTMNISHQLKKLGIDPEH